MQVPNEFQSNSISLKIMQKLEESIAAVAGEWYEATKARIYNYAIFYDRVKPIEFSKYLRFDTYSPFWQYFIESNSSQLLFLNASKGICIRPSLVLDMLCNPLLVNFLCHFIMSTSVGPRHFIRPIAHIDLSCPTAKPGVSQKRAARERRVA
jgi:hypothetical protein